MRRRNGNKEIRLLAFSKKLSRTFPEGEFGTFGPVGRKMKRVRFKLILVHFEWLPGNGSLDAVGGFLVGAKTIAGTPFSWKEDLGVCSAAKPDDPFANLWTPIGPLMSCRF